MTGNDAHIKRKLLWGIPLFGIMVGILVGCRQVSTDRGQSLTQISVIAQPAPPRSSEWTTYRNGNDINQLLFDRQGNLWAATTGGVVRWDLKNSQYTRYTKDHGLPDHNATDIISALDGTIWIRTSHGISHFKDESWQSYPLENYKNWNRFYSISRGTGKELWVSSMKGLWQFDGDNWRLIDEKTTTRDPDFSPEVRKVFVQSNGTIWRQSTRKLYYLKNQEWVEAPLPYYIDPSFHMTEGPDGTMWIGYAGEVFHFDGTNWTTYGAETGLPPGRIFGMAWDSQQRLWVGMDDCAWSGLAWLDNQRWQAQPLFNRFLNSDSLTDMATAPDGSLWLGSTVGIFHYKGIDWTETAIPGQWEVLLVPELPKDRVITLVSDSQKGVWLSTENQLTHFDGQKWHETSFYPYIYSGAMDSIVISPNNGIWTGFTIGLTAHWDGKRWQIYKPTDKVDMEPTDYEGFSVMAMTKNGDLWFGGSWRNHNRGLARFNGKEWTVYHDSSFNHLVASFLAAPDGTLWAGTYDGLFHYDGKKWVPYTEATITPYKAIHTLALAPDGTLWMGKKLTIVHFDGQNWKSYPLPEMDKMDWEGITALKVAPNGIVWIGTQFHGAFSFDGQTWKNYTPEEGLTHDRVTAIDVTPDGAIWFSTAGGISRYQP